MHIDISLSVYILLNFVAVNKVVIFMIYNISMAVNYFLYIKLLKKNSIIKISIGH